MLGGPQLVMHGLQSKTKVRQGETKGGGEGKSGKKTVKGN